MQVKLKLWLGVKQMGKREFTTYSKNHELGKWEKKWLYFTAGYPEKAKIFARKVDADLFGCKKGGGDLGKYHSG